MGDALFFLDVFCLGCVQSAATPWACSGFAVRRAARAPPCAASTSPALLHAHKGTCAPGTAHKFPCALGALRRLSRPAASPVVLSCGPSARVPEVGPGPPSRRPPWGLPALRAGLCRSAAALRSAVLVVLRACGPCPWNLPPPMPCPPLGGGLLFGPACGRLRGTARRRRCPGAAARRPAAQRPGRCRLPRRRICPQGAPAPQPRPKARREGARVPPRPSARTDRLS